MNVFATSWLLVARGVNGSLVDTNFFLISGSEAWRVDSGSSDAGLLTIFRLEFVGRVDGSTGGETSFFAEAGLGLETGRVYCVLVVDANFLTVARLELGSVLTFGKVNLGLVLVTTVVRELYSDISLRVVAAALVWLGSVVVVVMVMSVGEFDVNVGRGVLVFYGSAFLLKIDFLAAAWSWCVDVISVLFAGDVNFFLSILLVAFAGAWRELGGEGRRLLLSFPSDALLFVWELDFTLDMSLLSGLNGVAPVRRREDAEGDRDAGVKVQVDDLEVREILFSNAFRRDERKTRRGLLLLGGKKRREESAFDDAS